MKLEMPDSTTFVIRREVLDEWAEQLNEFSESDNAGDYLRAFAVITDGMERMGIDHPQVRCFKKVLWLLCWLSVMYFKNENRYAS